jgi:protein-L-isoaspartate(D-aspartate) O-methyltransferase
MEREDLLKRLEFETDVFRNEAVKKAFHAIDRKDFMLPDYVFEAYEDYTVPTIDGNTITQPTTIAFMLELLDVQEGDTVLDIGSGTGYTSALLADMAGPDGRVIALEINPALVEVSMSNLRKYKHLPVEIMTADDEVGYYRGAPYERILSSASFPDKETAPVDLLLQLAPGGVMVVPIGDSLFKFVKNHDDEIEEEEFPGFTFDNYQTT